MIQKEHDPMTFALQVKTEIVHNKGLISRFKKPLTYGMLLCGKSFSGESITLSTEYRGAARLYAKLIFSQVTMGTTVTMQESIDHFERKIFFSKVDDQEDRKAILNFFGHQPEEKILSINKMLLTGAEERFAFFAGAFLACSNLSDPQKTYHLEFVLQQEELAEDLLGLLEECGVKFHRGMRRGQQIVYCKDSKSIEDMLTMMGATSAMMNMVNVKIYKDVRNQVNRVTNCETSNIERTVSASTVQVADIRYLRQTGRFDTLEPILKETAIARIRNPDLSLRELGERLGISRSGLNHRLQKIAQIAKAAREG